MKHFLYPSQLKQNYNIEENIDEFILVFSKNFTRCNTIILLRIYLNRLFIFLNVQREVTLCIFKNMMKVQFGQIK